MFARETLVGCTPLAHPIAVYFVPSNREPASKQVRFFRRWRRSACFPLLFNKTRRRRAICAANRRGTNKKRTSKRMSSFYCQAASIRIFLRRTPFPRPVNQRSVCRTKNEEQQNERTMSFYKKLIASDMTLATSCQVASIRIFSPRKPCTATACKFPTKNTRNFFEVLLTLFEPPSEFNTSITRPAFGTHPAAVLASILPLSADR